MRGPPAHGSPDRWSSAGAGRRAVALPHLLQPVRGPGPGSLVWVRRRGWRAPVACSSCSMTFCYYWFHQCPTRIQVLLGGASPITLSQYYNPVHGLRAIPGPLTSLDLLLRPVMLVGFHTPRSGPSCTDSTCVPVLDPHGADRSHAALVRVRVQHPESSPGASRGQSGIPRHQPRGILIVFDRVFGSFVPEDAGGLRIDEEHHHSQPCEGRVARVLRHRQRREIDPVLAGAVAVHVRTTRVATRPVSPQGDLWSLWRV